MITKRQKKLAIIGVVLLLVYALGFVFFVKYVHSLRSNNEKYVDAIVVLTGGSNRLLVASDLFNRGLAPKLFISGVGGGANFDNMSGAEVLPKEKRDLPELGREASNTLENALEVSLWVNALDLKSMMLVTSDYHMPRSLFEFKTVMPTIKIVSFAVPFNSEKKGFFMEFYLMFKEYNKYIVAYLRTLF